MTDALARSVERFLSLEAALVDDKRWDEWLDLFAPDVEFWVPSWDSDTELTQDPGNDLSLIYYSGRFGLEDRVYRLRLGTSAASVPEARTTHFVTNVLPTFLPDGTCEVRASWQANVYRFKITSTFYGNYTYLLAPRGDGWVIKKKKIVLVNDAVPSFLDIYCI